MNQSINDHNNASQPPFDRDSMKSIPFHFLHTHSYNETRPYDFTVYASSPPFPYISSTSYTPQLDSLLYVRTMLSEPSWSSATAVATAPSGTRAAIPSRPSPSVAIPVRICGLSASDLRYDSPSPPPLCHPKGKQERLHSPCTKLASTLLPVCKSGWPTTICKNRCKPSRRCSITSSLNRFVNTFPGSGGMVTRADSRSRMSRKYSKSL